MIGVIGACLVVIAWLIDTLLGESMVAFVCACVGALMFVAWYIHRAWRLGL